MKNTMKRLVSYLFMGLFAANLWAGERTVEDAARLAAEFMNQTPALRARYASPRTATSMRLAYTGLKTNQTTPAFYVFNQSEGNGAVIVSADDRTETILGYTDAGSFDMETANPHLRWWLGRYSKQIAALTDEAAVSVRQQTQAYTPITPLLGNIEYDQETPYSNLCPLDGTHRSLTGCVATAAAQVMRKWKYPAQGTGTYSYTTATLNKVLSVDFGATTYDWDNMLEKYTKNNYTSAQAKAVATLMYHCGVASDMDYSYDAGSGTQTDNMARGLANHFGYKVEKFVTQWSKREYGTTMYSPAEYSVTTTQLTSYFHADLEAGRPIIMGGNDEYQEGGHEFVCDGRDANGKFHINWGWSGDGNGYFAISALETSGYDFSYDLDAILGIEPQVIDTVHVTSVSVSPTSLTLKINEKQTLKATILPADATIRNATWTSSNPQVASVNSGVVKGLKQGTATITATAENKSATATITVTSEVAMSDAFVRVTDASELETDMEILIVNEENSVALSTTQGNNNRSEAAVTINDDAIEIEDDNTDVQIITLTAGNQTDTYGLEVVSGYLYAASSTKNYLRTQVGLTDNSSWAISIEDGEAEIVAQGGNKRNILRYNKSNHIFSAYAQGQEPVAIYARSKGVASALNEQVLPEQTAQKVMRNGQIYILRDGKWYNMLGELVQDK
ncbi:MAG: C10 family peptidase [Paludibacteraceae bacterium]|nr:C10 family peptidase [Paludibacteraceae bacterium]